MGKYNIVGGSGSARPRTGHGPRGASSSMTLAIIASPQRQRASPAQAFRASVSSSINPSLLLLLPAQLMPRGHPPTFNVQLALHAHNGPAQKAPPTLDRALCWTRDDISCVRAITHKFEMQVQTDRTILMAAPPPSQRRHHDRGRRDTKHGCRRTLGGMLHGPAGVRVSRRATVSDASEACADADAEPAPARNPGPMAPRRPLCHVLRRRSLGGQQ